MTVFRHSLVSVSIVSSCYSGMPHITVSPPLECRNLLDLTSFRTDTTDIIIVLHFYSQGRHLTTVCLRQGAYCNIISFFFGLNLLTHLTWGHIHIHNHILPVLIEVQDSSYSQLHSIATISFQLFTFFPVNNAGRWQPHTVLPVGKIMRFKKTWGNFWRKEGDLILSIIQDIFNDTTYRWVAQLNSCLKRVERVGSSQSGRK